VMMPFEWDVRVFLEGSHGGRTYVRNDRRGHHGLHHYAGLNYHASAVLAERAHARREALTRVSGLNDELGKGA